jgi:hypothetical protein
MRVSFDCQIKKTLSATNMHPKRDTELLYFILKKKKEINIDNVLKIIENSLPFSAVKPKIKKNIFRK